ncbi:hypothetical protein [Mycobacterium kansasii]|uniref:hypothetical protein n=1 Tax=Mycobacterium kansasii TaxID=1768 RepID=UPI0004D72A62|nr:hypothetical protein [Mycobacterium kansasii]KEP38761.1 transglycosylase [Mycobacterium kansasii]
MSSLDELVVEAGRALGDGRRLFGASPVIAGGWSSTPALGFGRDGVAAAGQAAATGWGGGAAKTFGGANNGQLFALDGVLAGDGGTGAGLAGGGQAAAAGGGGMDGVITDTRSGVAAIAPATTTPAGKRELVTHLQGQLDRAKALLRVSERRNVELAKLIEQGSVGYGMMGATPMGGAAAMGAAPMGMGAAGGGAVGSPLSIPGLDTALAGLTHHHNTPKAGLDLAFALGGPGEQRVRAAIGKALDIEGIHDPVARARWEAGMMLVAKRESGFRNDAVNRSDSNADRGDPSSGSFQFTGATFRQYNQPGTSGSRSDDVAEACAFINYARARYHVAADATNLATNIQQADPTRPPKGY